MNPPLELVEPASGAATAAKRRRSAELGMWELGGSDDELTLSDEARRLLGLGHRDRTFKALLGAVHKDDRRGLRRAVRRVVEGRGPVRVEHRLARDGERVLEHVLHAGPSGRVVGSVQDISERRSAELRADYLSRHDLHTGLANREAFAQHLAQQVESCGDQSRLALALVHVDKLGAIADRVGASTDQRLARMAANRLGRLASKRALGRLSDDVFGVLVALDGMKDADAVGEHLRPAFEEPLGIDVHCTVSVGIAVYPNDAENSASLLAAAACAVASAQASGGGCRYHEPEVSKHLEERAEVESALRAAVRRHRLSLRYELRREVAGDGIHGGEVLLGWRDEQLDQLDPDRLAPIVDEAGLARPIAEWLLDAACDRAAEPQRAAPWQEERTSSRVAVNVSARVLARADFAERLLGKLAARGIAPSTLEVGVSETGLEHDDGAAVWALGMLRDAGVGVALDGFGRGRASLATLVGFPFDTVKIDPVLTRRIGSSPASEAIIRSTISCARELGVRTVGAGVVEQSQRDFLAHCRCELVQG